MDRKFVVMLCVDGCLSMGYFRKCKYDWNSSMTKPVHLREAYIE